MFLSSPNIHGGGIVVRKKQLQAHIAASHEVYVGLVGALLIHPDIRIAPKPAKGVAQVILDYPTTWAFRQLESMGSIERARTVIATQSTVSAYLDCLGSYHVSGVVGVQNVHGLLGAMYAASLSQRSYQWDSDLTYMEMRVLRLLFQGAATRTAASALGISFKTVNAHVSNVLCKLELANRSQMIAFLLGTGCRFPASE
jgi:DNA-binding CsgD family transcriptional regulator